MPISWLDRRSTLEAKLAQYFNQKIGVSECLQSGGKQRGLPAHPTGMLAATSRMRHSSVASSSHPLCRSAVSPSSAAVASGIGGEQGAGATGGFESGALGLLFAQGGRGAKDRRIQKIDTNPDPLLRKENPPNNGSGSCDVRGPNSGPPLPDRNDRSTSWPIIPLPSLFLHPTKEHDPNGGVRVEVKVQIDGQFFWGGAGCVVWIQCINYGLNDSACPTRSLLPPLGQKKLSSIMYIKYYI